MMKLVRATQTLSAIVVSLGLSVGAALAAPNDTPAPSAKVNADYANAEKLIEAKNYAAAIPLLKKAEKADPDNADVHNYLGYAHRNLQQYDAAMQHYEIALKLEPKHRGANEYMGELYLKLDQLAKAEERLAVLDSACLFGCEEYTDLKKAIAAYKARTGKGS